MCRVLQLFCVEWGRGHHCDGDWAVYPPPHLIGCFERVSVWLWCSDQRAAFPLENNGVDYLGDPSQLSLQAAWGTKYKRRKISKVITGSLQITFALEFSWIPAWGTTTSCPSCLSYSRRIRIIGSHSRIKNCLCYLLVVVACSFKSICKTTNLFKTTLPPPVDAADIRRSVSCLLVWPLPGPLYKTQRAPTKPKHIAVVERYKSKIFNK